MKKFIILFLFAFLIFPSPVNAQPEMVFDQHGDLFGLGDDDHSQYCLLLGRAGGQTIIGGTGSGDHLLLQSTSHGTKGDVIIGNALTGILWSGDDENATIGGGSASHTINGITEKALWEFHTSGNTAPGGTAYHRHSNTPGLSSDITFLKSSGDHGTPTIIANGEQLGHIRATGFDGVDYALAAEISMFVDAVPGVDDMGGRIVLATSPDGAQVPVEALRIDNAQQVIIATGKNLVLGSDVWNSGDLINMAKAADDDLGDVSTSGGVWSIDSGAVLLNEIGDPDGNGTISMGNNTWTITSSNPAGGLLFNMTGAGSGHYFKILQNTGNPSAGTHLFHVEGEDTDVVQMHIKHIGDQSDRQMAIWELDRATPAAGDNFYWSSYFSDSVGNQDEFARLRFYADDETTATEDGSFRIELIQNAVMTEVFNLSSVGDLQIDGIMLSTGLTIGAAAILEAELEILDGATLTTVQLNYLNAATGTTGTTSTNLVFSTSPTLITPALGTPSALVLTNATGLPISTGVTGLGANVATWLATPSSSNLANAMTGETGTGALVFGTSPTLITPALGTPSALVGTNITGIPAGAYNASSIDGDDVNSNIAGRSLTLTPASPDTFDADPELYTFAIHKTLETPTDADDFIIAPYIALASTITKIRCISEDATSTTIRIDECDSAGDNCAGIDGATTIVCDVSGEDDDGSLSNPGIDIGDSLRLVVTATSGTPGHVAVTITGTRND